MRFLNFVGLTLSAVIASVKAAEIYSCTEPNTIALTFDDGPYQYTEELIDELDAAGIHATFFINGKNWYGVDLATIPEQSILGKAAASGHQVASHTYNHLIPPTNEERAADLANVENLIEANTGYRPNYFRAPKGECDEACIAFIESLGYKIINWDTDTNDWNFQQFQEDPTLETDDPAIVKPAKKKNVAHVKKFLTEEFAKKKSNYLVLMHDVQDHTVKEIVPWLIKNKPEGYKFVTVAECLGDPTLGKITGARAAPVAPVAPVATSTVAVQPLDAQPTVVSENTSFNLQAKSGANTIAINFSAALALIICSLYMLL